MSKKARFLFANLAPYPKGEAISIRNHSICKALAAHGHDVKHVTITPLTNNSNNNPAGIEDGVEYVYPCGCHWKFSNRLLKYFTLLIGFWKLAKIAREYKPDYLISGIDKPVIAINFILTKIWGNKLIIERTEYPRNCRNSSQFGKKVNVGIIRLHYLADGFMVISKALQDYYSALNKNIFLLPVSIDPLIYKNIETKEITEQYIAVVFNVHNRDCIEDTVSAYKIYRENNPTAYRLKLIGNFDLLCSMHPKCREIIRYIEEHGLTNHIDFTGRIESNEVRVLLKNAKCLLTTAREYVSGGFPTKLAEYLLSGVPVVATAAGEIGDYLTNNETVFLTPPADVYAIAQKLLFVQNNRKKALEIAANGLEYTKKVFNAETYIDDLLLFLNNIGNRI